MPEQEPETDREDVTVTFWDVMACGLRGFAGDIKRGVRKVREVRK